MTSLSTNLWGTFLRSPIEARTEPRERRGSPALGQTDNMAGESQASISLRDVGLSIDGSTLLQGVTAELTETRIAVIGRNGSGKSTLLRLIAGLSEASAGTVRVDGKDPFTDREFMLGRIGILFQNPDHQILFPTVGEELAFGLRQQGLAAGEADARVLALLEQEGRRDWLLRPTHLLSHGQRQYLCLLAVLLMQPATILLDEPFSGLDLPTRIGFERRLSALDQQTIIVTHDVEDARSCQRVLWIEAGRIVADGPPDRVLDRYLARMLDLGEMDAGADIPR